MARIYIEDIGQHDGQTVTLKGWLYNKRSSGKLRFLQLRDGTGIIQCVVFKKGVDESTWTDADEIVQESACEITGAIQAEPRAPGGYEMQVTVMKTLSQAQEYPITPKEHGTSFLMDHRHLWLRSSRQQAILRIRSALIHSCRRFFDNRKFLCVDAPIFTPAACEGTTTLFETEYFDQKAYLTQSGQLYSEAGAMAFGKVYCFGPTFRAEKSKTRRHLTEFWMIEPEVAFNDLNDNMDLAEAFVSTIVQEVLEQCKEEFKIIERDTTMLEKVVAPFPRIHYKEAVKILHDKGVDFEDGGDFGGADETVISEQFDRPVLVHHFPAAIKAFYMKRDPEDEKYALGCDMLAPEGYGEIIGGGQREDNLEVLEQRIQEHGLSKAPFEWYLDLRRYGAVPHSGFGMGLERAVSWICGLTHVRETIPFARTLSRLTP
jgi:asparaginyl-tRNA synthetase